MNPGRLNKRITIERLTRKKHENGEIIEDYEVFKTIWAEIKPVSGNQFFVAKQINSEISHNVYIRYRSDLNPSMRIKFKDRAFEILYLMNVNEGNQLMQIYCKELLK